MVQNVFQRIQINALVEWATPLPINLTTNSIDWLVPPKTGTSNLTGTRKSGGGSLITATVIGSDAGSNQDASVSPNFTWTDGTAAASNIGNHVSGLQVIGNGIRIEVPAPRWPDWQILRVWYATGNPTQIKCEASMTGDADAVTVSDGVGGDPDFGGFNAAYASLGGLAPEVKFCSDRAGQTLRFDITRNNGSMGYFIFSAAALYAAPINKQPAKGAVRCLEASGIAGPIGAC